MEERTSGPVGSGKVLSCDVIVVVVVAVDVIVVVRIPHVQTRPDSWHPTASLEIPNVYSGCDQFFDQPA